MNVFFQIVESVVKNYEEGSVKPIEDMTLDELEEIEDEADETILLQYRYTLMVRLMSLDIYGVGSEHRQRVWILVYRV